MKLKRIISALVVFTLVMTSMVCVVNAEDAAATYQTITTYDVSTGEMTVNAKLAGAKEGSMVSYIIYGDADKANNAEEAVAEGNIVHIDQATVGADGTASFDAVTTDFADFENRQVQFVSNEETLAPWNNGGKETGRAYSVETISNLQTSVLFVSKAANSGTPIIYALIDGVPTSIGGTGSNIGTRWAIDKTVADAEKLNIPTLGQFVDLSKATAVMVEFGAKDGRDSWHSARFYKYTGSYNGNTQTVKNSSIVYKTSNAQVVGGTVADGSVNMLVDGFYKDDITDNNLAGITLTGGDIIGIDMTNAKPTDTSGAKTVKYATTFDPIVGTYSTTKGTFPAVTFLCSMADTAVDADAEMGLNIYRYEKVANSKDAVLEQIASCAGEPTEAGRFGIQLFDGSNSGELDPEKYDFVAYPYIVVDGEKVELSVFGDTYVTDPTAAGGNNGSAYYYERDRRATAEITAVAE